MRTKSQQIRLAQRLVDGRREHLVRFRKKDGSVRIMRFRYAGGPVRLPYMLVHDIEADAPRQLNLDTLETVGFRPAQTHTTP